MVKLSAQKPTQTKSELLAVPVCEDHLLFTSPTLKEMVQKSTELIEFSGKKDENLLLYNPTASTAERVLFIGIGKLEKVDAECLRQFAGKAVKNAIQKGLSKVDLLFPEDPGISVEKKDLIEALLEGAGLANHIDEKYKKEKKTKSLKTIRLLVSSADAKKYTRLADRISAICKATCLAREWINMPSNDKPPLILAGIMASAARSAGLKVTLMKEKELVGKKFGALLAVASGSINRPCLLILEYVPPEAKKCVVLVGKGVTFDAGGINLKPSAGMEDMKADMSGAAAVSAALLAMAEIKPDIGVVGVLPLVENLPSGGAYRPGDIVRAYGGKTIEIGNTDAEGRLILADAMGYARDQFSPDIIIDMATLTGACVVALGEKIAGVFSSDDTLAEKIVAAGRHTHERCWHMPLPDDYKTKIKSDIADIRNVGKTRWGGAISAGLFLSEFVSDSTWAHIDIAGPAFGKSDNAYTPNGASGFGVRLLCRLLEQI